MGLEIFTYSIGSGPSWECNWFSVIQEIPRILWNPKVHYLIHKFPPPVLILSQIKKAFVNGSQHDTLLGWGVVSTSPNPQAGGPHLVRCQRLFIQYTRSYLPCWRPFLHPQSEEAPGRGDRNTFIMARNFYLLKKFRKVSGANQPSYTRSRLHFFYARSQNCGKRPFASRNLCLFFRPSFRMERLSSHWTKFHKTWNLSTSWKSFEKI